MSDISEAVKCLHSPLLIFSTISQVKTFLLFSARITHLQLSEE